MSVLRRASLRQSSADRQSRDASQDLSIPVQLYRYPLSPRAVRRQTAATAPPLPATSQVAGAGRNCRTPLSTARQAYYRRYIQAFCHKNTTFLL